VTRQDQHRPRQRSRDTKKSKFQQKRDRRKGKIEYLNQKEVEEDQEEETYEQPSDEGQSYNQYDEDQEETEDEGHDDQPYKKFSLPKAASSLMFTTGGVTKLKPSTDKPTPAPKKITLAARSFSLDELEEPAEEEDEQTAPEHDEEVYEEEEEAFEGVTYNDDEEDAGEEEEYNDKVDEQYQEEFHGEQVGQSEVLSIPASRDVLVPFAKNDPLYALEAELRAILEKTHKTLTRGTCTAMCPPSEIKAREFERALSKFEIDYSYVPRGKQDRYRAVRSKMVKAYAKASAGTTTDPSVIRPIPVLEKTMHYLVHEIFGLEDHGIIEMYSFIRDRCRGINQDLTLQNADTVEAVELLERISRFHIISEYLFCEEEGFNHQRMQNMQILNKYLISLAELYRDLRARGISCEHEVEFHGYMIIFLMDDYGKNPKDRLELVQYLRKLPQDVIQTPHMQSILKLYALFKQQNFYAFFEHAQKKFDFLTLCQLHRVLSPVRMRALHIFKKAFRNSYSLEDWVDFLKFDSTLQATNFLKAFGVRISGDKISFPQSIPSINYADLPIERSYWIDGKKPVDISYADLLDGLLWSTDQYERLFRKRAVRAAPSTLAPPMTPVLRKTSKKTVESPRDKTTIETAPSMDAATTPQLVLTPSPSQLTPKDKGDEEAPQFSINIPEQHTPKLSPSPAAAEGGFQFGTPVVSKQTTPKSSTQPKGSVPKFDFDSSVGAKQIVPKVSTPTTSDPHQERQTGVSQPTNFTSALGSSFSQLSATVPPSDEKQKPLFRRKVVKLSPPKPTREELVQKKMEQLSRRRENEIIRTTLVSWRLLTRKKREERQAEQEARERAERMRRNYLESLSNKIEQFETTAERYEYLYGVAKTSHYIRPQAQMRARQQRLLEERFMSPVEFASHIFYSLAKKNINVNTVGRSGSSPELKWKLSLLHNSDQELCVWLHSKFAHNPSSDDANLLCQLNYRGDNITISSPDGKPHTEEAYFEWYLENMCDAAGLPLYDDCSLQACVRAVRLDEIDIGTKEDLHEEVRGSSGLLYVLPLPSHDGDATRDVYWQEVQRQLHSVLSAVHIPQLEREIALVVVYDSILFLSRAQVCQRIQSMASTLPASRAEIHVAVIEVPFSEGTLSSDHVHKLDHCLTQSARFIAQHAAKQPQMRSMLLSDFVQDCVSAHFGRAVHGESGLIHSPLIQNQSPSQFFTVDDSPPPPISFSLLIDHVNGVIRQCAHSIGTHLHALKKRINWPPPELVAEVDDWASKEYLSAIHERLADFLIHDTIVDDTFANILSKCKSLQDCFREMHAHCAQFAAKLIGEKRCPPNLESYICTFLTHVIRYHMLGDTELDPTVYVELFVVIFNNFVEHEDDHRFPVVHTFEFNSDAVQKIYVEFEPLSLIPANILAKWQDVETLSSSSSYREDSVEYEIPFDDQNMSNSGGAPMEEEGTLNEEPEVEERCSSDFDDVRHVVRFLDQKISANKQQVGEKRKRIAPNGDLSGAPQAKRMRIFGPVGNISIFAEIDNGFDHLRGRVESECEESDKWTKWLEKVARE